MIVEHLIGIEPVALRDLGDHLVGAAVETEIVDVAAAQQRAERAADIAQLESELRGLCPIDYHRGLRLVDLQVVIEEDELSALQCLGGECPGNVIEPFERIGGLDHELDRQAGRTR